MRTSLAVAVICWLLAGTLPASASPLRLHVLPMEDTHPVEPVTATASLKDMAGEVVSRELKFPGSTTFEVEANTTYTLSISAPGRWLPEQVVHTTQGEDELVLRLFATGSLQAQIQVAQDQEMPEEMLLRFVPSPKSETKLPEGSLRCPIGDDLRLACEIPAGQLDFRLRARGFITHSFWDALVKPGEVRKLGTLKLVRGASVVGWLEPPSKDFRYDEVEIRLRPQISAYGTTADFQRQEQLLEKASVNDRGFFEIPGVAPGNYRLEAVHPEYATTTLAPVQVLRDAETEIRSLSLEPPASLTVRVDPPHHPYRTPWTVRLLKRSPVPGHSDQVAEGSTSEDGVFHANHLEPGDYRVSISDGRDDTWFYGDILLEATSDEMLVTLPILRVEGTVTLGDEPLAATVYFGGRSGAQRIAVDSDEEGRFYTFLPEEESWLVDVRNPDRAVAHRIEALQVEPGPESRRARVHIEIPHTMIRGTVVNSSGQPVPGAQVTILGDEKNISSTTAAEPDGHFELRGMVPGRVRLEAEHHLAGETWFADVVELHLQEDEIRDDIRLVLRPQKELGGQVVDAEGRGVPGAMVVPMLVQDAGVFSLEVRKTVTDVDGAFSIRLPAATQNVDLMVFPPGFAAKQQPVSFSEREDKTVMVFVEPVGGTLTMLRDPAQREQWLHLYHQGSIPVAWLRRWARLHGESLPPERWAFPMMEPGEYTACLLPEYSFASRPPAGSEGRCTSGTLTPYGELVLDLTDSVEETTEAQEVATRLVDGPSNL